MEKDKYIAFKIKKLKEEGYNNSQSAAIAYSYWNKEHDKMQQGGTSLFNYQQTGDQGITSTDVNKINQATGIQFTPEFAQSYYSTQSQPTVPPPPAKNYSQLPIQDITSDGQWTDRKVWRTQRPEYFLGKREPIEGQDYTRVPYKQWGAYQSSPEYMNYINPQTQTAQNAVSVLQQGGAIYPNQYQMGYPSIVNNFAPSPYIANPQPVTEPDFVDPGFNSFNYANQLGRAMQEPQAYVGSQYQFSDQPRPNNPTSTPQQQFNDTTRFNVINPYGGIDLESSLAYAGQGFGEGNYGKAGLGTGLSVLKGARNFLTGFATGKESDRVKKEMYDDLYNPSINYAYLQQGGKVPTNAQMLTGEFVTDQGAGNYNLENNEYIKRAQTGEVQQVVGEPHIKNGKEADGVNVTLENGDKVLSDYTKIPAKNVKELKERYDLSLRKGATFADAQKAYDKKLGIQKETDELTTLIEKYGNNSAVKDETTKRLNDVVLSKEIEASKKKLDLLGNPQSMMFEDLFKIQESLPKKGNGELLDKNGKPLAQEGTKKYQQGGEIDDLAQKFGISPERARELLVMQEGGAVPEEQVVAEQQTAETEQPTQEQVMQFITQSLQNGAQPEQVLQQLVSNGVPQDIATQMIQAVIGQAPQEAPVEEGLPVAQQGTEAGFSFATRYAPPVAGYDVTGRSVIDKDLLTGVEPIQSYTGAGYGQQMANVEDLIKLHDWYFDTEAKKEAFRKAAKKEGSQPEVREFQTAYNTEILKRGEKAGVPKDELNNIINQVGFTEEGARKLDGLVGAFTSTRPLYDFKKQDGEVKVEVKPIEAVQTPPNVEQRNITKNVIPMLPQDLRLAPSALNPLAKEQIALGRAEPTKLTPESQLAEQERLRQTDVARLQASGLNPVQQEAILAQGLASSQMASNDAIARVELANQANQAQVDQFNIGQAAKESLTNAQFNQVYQNQMMQSIANEERDWRNFYQEQNLQNRQNYKDIEAVNLLNAQQDQYAYVPGQPIQFLNNRATNLALPSLPTDIYANMTAEQIEAYKKAQIAKSRAEGMKNYTTTVKTV